MDPLNVCVWHKNWRSKSWYNKAALIVSYYYANFIILSRLILSCFIFMKETQNMFQREVYLDA